MANLFSSSIGKKLIMSLSGSFLILFLLIHLIINSFLLLDGVFGFEEGQMFNAGAHFMGTFPLIKVIEPILGLGFLIHIFYSIVLYFQNKKARGSVKYASGDKTKDVEWSSKNMFVLGFVYLFPHLIQAKNSKLNAVLFGVILAGIMFIPTGLVVRSIWEVEFNAIFIKNALAHLAIGGIMGVVFSVIYNYKNNEASKR